MLTRIKQFFQKFKWKGDIDKMNDLETNYILTLINEFEASEERELMLKAKDYYVNKTDIRFNKKYYYDENENKVLDTEKANNKISHSFLKLLVDEKVNYLLAEPFVFESKTDSKNIEDIKDILDEEFLDTIMDTGIESSCCGIAWLHAYIGEEGKLMFTLIDSEQIIPLWTNQNKKELDGVIRYYYVDYYVGLEKKQKMKIEYWTKEGVTYYIKENGMLLIDEVAMEEQGAYHIVTVNGGQAWGKVPFIPFKNNSKITSDLIYVKPLIDEYDKRTSETSNTLDEIQEIIYVLREYGGTNLSEFMRNLKHYKAIKVNDTGGVEVVKADINIDAIEKHLDRVKSDFYHFGQGVDMDVDKFGNNPSGVALEFIFSRLKLKVGAMERKYKTSFKGVLYFVSKYLELNGNGKIDIQDINVVFNKSTIANISESIDSCSKSNGVISNKTIIANHPWVDDVELEIEKMEEEQGNNFDIPFENSNTNLIPTGDPKEDKFLNE